MQLLTGFVDGFPAQPQRGGLLDAAFPGPTRDESGRDIEWQLGVQCWPENTAGWTIVHDGATDLDDPDTEVDYGNADTDPQPVAARPVMLRTSVRGPKPSRGDDLQALMRNRVLRRLDAVTSQAMARELWTGRLSQSQPFGLAAGYDWLNPAPPPLTTPAGVSATPSTTDGTLAAATRYYRVSAVNAQGETLAAAQQSAATTGTTGSVALTWTAVPGATGYRVYRSDTSGSWGGPALLASPAGNSYTDTGADTPAAGAPAGSNTAATGTFSNAFLNAEVASAGNVIADAAAPLTPMRALGAIEAAAGDLVAGGPLTIHVPLAVLTEVAWSLKERTVGGQGDDPQRTVLTTAKGSLVCADTGYPGWGPGIDEGSDAADQAVAWMYGSGPVMTWIGEATPYDRLEAVVNPQTNRAEMWAERPFLTLLDPSTVVGAAVAPLS